MGKVYKAVMMILLTMTYQAPTMIRPGLRNAESQAHYHERSKGSNPGSRLREALCGTHFAQECLGGREPSETYNLSNHRASSTNHLWEVTFKKHSHFLSECLQEAQSLFL